jgi:hypothetical protein
MVWVVASKPGISSLFLSFGLYHRDDFRDGIITVL